MSFTITTDVFCDYCPQWTSGVVEGRINRAKAWKKAKSEGWSKENGKHICPDCDTYPTRKLQKARKHEQLVSAIIKS